MTPAMCGSVWPKRQAARKKSAIVLIGVSSDVGAGAARTTHDGSGRTLIRLLADVGIGLVWREEQGGSEIDANCRVALPEFFLTGSIPVARLHGQRHRRVRRHL
jgi:hypothetical protein